ncbi:MAG: acyloxyacyl hydrolase [Rhodospirillales bacterium]|nr:acyloxyacyl hydrolase [Rhodospirillales bacterium]
MGFKMLRGVMAALALASAALVFGPVRAAEPDESLLQVHGGVFDIRTASRWRTGEFGVAWQPSHKLWIFKPHVGALVTLDSSAYAYAGLLTDIDLSPRLVLTLSTAAGAWRQGDGKSLGNAVEFRSGFDLAYRFHDQTRLGLGLYHMSNAGLGDKNPGEETVQVSYAVPLKWLFGP